MNIPVRVFCIRLDEVVPIYGKHCGRWLKPETCKGCTFNV